MKPLLVLSPHLDDAALSCGGRIVRAVDAGRRAVVATFFTQDEPLEPPTPFAADLRRWWKLAAGEVMKSRRAEDLEACRRLAAEPRHLDLPEGPYRRGAGGAILYPDLATLFGELHPDDAPWIDRLVTEIRGLVEGLGGDVELVAPLGVGGHVDHRLLRAAAGRCALPVAFYEEFPYVAWKWLALRRALVRPSDWVSESLPISDSDLERKGAAIAAYVSQVPAMFRTEARLRKQLRRHRRKAGGERVWRPRAAAPASR